MTTSIRKTIPTPLEQKYTEMRKESGGNKRNPNWVKNDATELDSTMPTDTVTLSSGQPDIENPTKLKRSQSVSPIEKQALQAQFSVHA
jgi:hypothetical protein